MQKITRKNSVYFLFVALAVLTLCLVAEVGSPFASEVAAAVGGEYRLDASGDDYVVTRVAGGAEIYRGAYDESAMASAIRTAEGGDYVLTLAAPTVTVLRTSGEEREAYSKTEYKFLFSASYTHPLSSLGGFNAPDSETGYDWSWSKSGTERLIESNSANASFGAGMDVGEYKVRAYVNASFRFDGKVIPARGYDETDVEITAEVSPSDHDYSTIYYGATLGSALSINGNGIGGRWTFASGVDTSAVPTAGSVDYPAIFEIGSWTGDLFTADPNYSANTTTLTVHVERTLVRVLVEPAECVQGESLPTFVCRLPDGVTLVGGQTLEDLELELYASDAGGNEIGTDVFGRYYVMGRCANGNYEVFFVDAEHLSSYYSSGASLVIYPRFLTVEEGGYVYRVESSAGFAFGDALILNAWDGEFDFGELGENRRTEGAKYLSAANGGTAVTLAVGNIRIEKKNDLAVYVLYSDGGEIKREYFDENGYAEFAVSALDTQFAIIEDIPLELRPSLDWRENSTARALTFLGLFALAAALGFAVSMLMKQKKWNENPDEAEPSANPESESTPEGTPSEGENANISNGEAAAPPENPVSTEKTEKLQGSPTVSAAQESPINAERDDSIEDAEQERTEIADGAEGVKLGTDGEDEKDTFLEKLLSSTQENKELYNALKNEIMSYKGIKSRTVGGGDYFRRTGKPLAKIVIIGSTLRLALALDPDAYDYNIYHQKDRRGMKKYAETPMFVKVQSALGLRRAEKLVADLMAAESIVKNKKYTPTDYLLDPGGNTED